MILLFPKARAEFLTSAVSLSIHAMVSSFSIPLYLPGCALNNISFTDSKLSELVHYREILKALSCKHIAICIINVIRNTNFRRCSILLNDHRLTSYNPQRVMLSSVSCVQSAIFQITLTHSEEIQLSNAIDVIWRSTGAKSSAEIVRSLRVNMWLI
jgi:hypothetical protein